MSLVISRCLWSLFSLFFGLPTLESRFRVLFSVFSTLRQSTFVITRKTEFGVSNGLMSVKLPQ